MAPLSRPAVFAVGFLLGLVVLNLTSSSRLDRHHLHPTLDAATTYQHYFNSTTIGPQDDSQQSPNSVGDDPGRLFYVNQPDRFVAEFARCARESTCKLLYWHVQKTGGTFFASRLYNVINRVKTGYNSRDWCCHDDFMKTQFRKDPQKYCNMGLGVFEVRPGQYREVVETCQRIGGRGDKDRHREYMGLITVREPLQRTLSQIHQQCNVHSSHLKPKEQRICRRCRYDAGVGEDQSFFDHIVSSTNDIYRDMKDMVDVVPSSSSKNMSSHDHHHHYLNVPLLVLNSEDMTDFFESLETHVGKIVPKKKVTTIDNQTIYEDAPYRLPRGRPNAQNSTSSNTGESEKLCDFAMPGSMMHLHQPSLDVYRWFQQQENKG